jgi:hypothetical protein
MAWLVTLPDEFATGEAVAETPPTLSASAFVGDKKPIPIDASNTSLTCFFKNVML